MADVLEHKATRHVANLKNIQRFKVGKTCFQNIYLISLVLALLTIVIYWPVTGNQFVEYDDHLYIVDNPNVASGLSWRGVQWAFTSLDLANWHPVTWLSHQLDVTVFGLNPTPHHAANLLLHTTNTLLLFFLLARRTNALWRSAIVAAVFALHPLHVESVAWISERKDLLCAFFFLLTLHAYLRYIRQGRYLDFLPVGFFFALSLMAKPMSVTLPFVLLLLDWWPLRRIGIVPLRTILLEKVPLLLFSGVSCAATMFVQHAGGAVMAVEKFSILERAVNVLSSYMLYLWKMVWPFNLALLYPLPDTPPVVLAIFGAIFIFLVTMAGFYLRKSQPYLLTGWLWYLGMLVPVIGLVQVGIQSHADRYTYLPMVGFSLAVVWGMQEMSEKWRHGHAFLKLLAAGVLLMFAIQTRQQVFVWRDSETLFRHTLASTSGNYAIHVNLAVVLWNQGQKDEAIAEYRKSIAIRPEYADIHFLLANALLAQGKTAEAAAEYRITLALQPEFRYAHNNLGVALQRIGHIEEAIVEYKEGLRLVPDDHKAKENLQILLKEQR